MQTEPVDPFIRAAGGFAIVSSLISAVGVEFLIALHVLLFATPLKTLGYTFGMLNDICVAIQYLLTIPIALALEAHGVRSSRARLGQRQDMSTALFIPIVLIPHTMELLKEGFCLRSNFERS